MLRRATFILLSFMAVWSVEAQPALESPADSPDSEVGQSSIQQIDPNQVSSLDSNTWMVRFSPPDSNEPNPASPGWKEAFVPGGLQGVEGYDSNVREMWYMHRFRIKGEIQHHLSVRLGRIDDKDRTYLNGQLIGETGQWEKDVPTSYDRVRIYEIPPGLIRKNGENTILVHVKGYFDGESGMVRGRTEIGPSSVMNRILRDEDYGEIIFLVAYFTAGSYFLFLFIRRRQNRENLLFAAFIYGFVFRQLIRTELRFELDISFLTFKRLEFALTYLLFIVFLYFVRVYFDLKKTITIRIVDIASVVMSAIMLGMAIHVFSTDDVQQWWFVQKNFGQPIWLLMLLCTIIIQSAGVIQGNRDGLYMLGGMLFVVIGFFEELAVSNGILNWPPVFSYFFAAFIFSLATILANRFVRLHRRVEDLNANLEQKVKDRTEELNHTLEKVQELKEQQDGDYFLTSLLMNPLGGNWSSSETLDVETLVEQKKKFHFRKWDSEIGGDLIAVYDVQLRGEKYTVFLNADAMGKSMQGAGGAIVVGTVFKSLISRTQVVRSASDKSPEQWLNECFLELQSVFLGFDGHMLVSAVLGMVHDASGTLYFANAEHPTSVLFRDGKAEPLSDMHHSVRKIGIEMPEGSFRVLVYRLRPGESVIVGSDGRDDLLLGEADDGHRIINEDEHLFLRAVEKAEGKLDRIKEALLEAGPLTDDLSLIRITYEADVSAVRESGLPHDIKEAVDGGDYSKAYELLQRQSYENASVLRAGVWLTRKLGKKEESAILAERLVESDPSDDTALYSCSLAQKRIGNLRAAIDYGERCRIRLPDHAKNLANLADCYRLQGDNERAISLVRRALNLDSSLQPAIELLRRLEPQTN